MYSIKTAFVQSLFRQRVRHATGMVHPTLPAIGPCGEKFVADPLSPFCIQAQQYQQDLSAVCYIAESTAVHTDGAHPHRRGSSSLTENHPHIRKLSLALHYQGHRPSCSEDEPGPNEYRCFECSQMVVCWEDAKDRKQAAFLSADEESFEATPRFYVKCHMSSSGELLCIICRGGVGASGAVVKYRNAAALREHLKTHLATELVKDPDLHIAKNPKAKVCAVM